jgi:hypothetical protein
VVENMAGFVAPDTGIHYEIFGPSHAEDVATTAGAPLLAHLPIDPKVASMCDAGEVEEVIRPEVKALVKSLEHLVPVSNKPVPHLKGV